MASEAVLDRVTDTSDSSAICLFGINSPFPMIVAITLYLLTILKIAPSFMKSRPAYQLKTYMVVYNVLQVIACVYLVYKIIVINLPTLEFWECADFERGSMEERDFNFISIFTFWLKVIELSETVVFVLRKKQRQVSFLHVFHHCATLFLVYQLHTSYKSSAALFPLFLNSNVHIVMYCYYLMAATLPANIVAKLTPFKKAITTIQMVQFAMILGQVIIALSRGCKVPRVILTIYVVIISAFFYMFYEFYKKNYTAKRQSAAAEAKKKRELNKTSDR